MRFPNRTKIVATIGPSSNTEEILTQLIESGVNVFRINAAHSDPKAMARTIRMVRRIDRNMRRGIGVLVDLQGPKIRVGRFEDGKPIWLRAGQPLLIDTEEGVLGCEAMDGEATRIGTTYRNLARDVEKGERVLLDDGYIELKVQKVDGHVVETKVVHGGLLKQFKGINLPGSKVSTEALTKKDRGDLECAIEHGADFVALSFVRSADDVKKLRSLLNKGGSEARIVSKIERPEAVGCIEEILAVSDALMVARGDMGVEMGPEVVPAVQKKMIRLAIEAHKEVITATQMLESMVTNPRPTRAEASDVANAIYDGSSAAMLSAETASGKYPVRAVKMMSTIIKHAETDIFANWELSRRRELNGSAPISLATVRAAVQAALDSKAKLLAVFTESGSTARLIAAQRTPTPIVAFTPFQETVQRLAMTWGVTALKVARSRTSSEMTLEGERMLLEMGYAKAGDRIVVVVGTTRQKGLANVMNIRTLGEE